MENEDAQEINRLVATVSHTLPHLILLEQTLDALHWNGEWLICSGLKVLLSGLVEGETLSDSREHQLAVAASEDTVTIIDTDTLAVLVEAAGVQAERLGDLALAADEAIGETDDPEEEAAALEGANAAGELCSTTWAAVHAARKLLGEAA